MYRIYLRSQDQRVRSKTNTDCRDEAESAFAAIVDRADLDGTDMLVVLNHDGKPIAYHRFGAKPGDSDYWRGRLDDIKWPEDRSGARRGGARAGAGRKAQTGDGGPLQRKTVNLDEASIATLTTYGDGELSEGIRRAARAIGATSERRDTTSSARTPSAASPIPVCIPIDLST